ncbi:hypothetical protein O3G_MSEX013077 [Manduca sexta]|uniref:Uncharacterized protein n=1 Tax=Manduca sexta TaxID=7130 RepID=A0A922CWI2_MANSE|nr:hypothetical protein O3G_MSEX013077 [Manduca sexta]
MNTTADIIHDTDERISKLQYIRQVEHISNMMHEIERKYKIKTNLHEKYDDDSHGPPTHYHGDPTVHSTPKPKRFKMNKYLENRMTIGTTKKRPKWWDLEYGWDIDYYW